MKHVSAKHKIYGVVAVWLILSSVALGYVFPLLNNMNKKVFQEIHAKGQDLSFLELEQQNFKQAKADLDKLAREPYQPDRFFNRDITLVEEIKALEQLGERLEVESNLSGLRGTLKEAAKAKTTKGEIFVVPFSLSLEGRLTDVVDYVESLENLPFLVNVSNISFNTGAGGNVTANLTANFYLKK